MGHSMQVKAWLYFWALGLIWGSSFLFIRIGVSELHPFHVVLFRTGIAAVGLCLVIILGRKRIPRDKGLLIKIALVGLGNVAIPYTLISWGEQSIDSGLAAVLQATAALFGLIVAHFFFADERITQRRAIGIILGFIGVAVLMSRNWQDGQLIVGSLLGGLAIVGASVFYATATTLGRKVMQGEVEPIVVSALSMLSGALAETVLIFVTSPFGTPTTIPSIISQDVLFAFVTLGVVNTFIAYLMFYSVIQALGVARATMVTYVVPVVGLILGALFLREIVDQGLIMGAALIFMGIAVVNLKRLPWQRQVVAKATLIE